jgi:hypothetical protein
MQSLQSVVGNIKDASIVKHDVNSLIPHQTFLNTKSCDIANV